MGRNGWFFRVPKFGGRGGVAFAAGPAQKSCQSGNIEESIMKLKKMTGGGRGGSGPIAPPLAAGHAQKSHQKRRSIEESIIKLKKKTAVPKSGGEWGAVA